MNQFQLTPNSNFPSEVIGDVAVNNPPSKDFRAYAVGMFISATITFSSGLASPLPARPVGQSILINQSTPEIPSGWTVAKVDLPDARTVRDYIETSVWGKPCRAMFNHLSMNNPTMLLAIVKASILSPALLTYAVEALGQVHDSNTRREALQTIIDLLSHESPLVREGAVYALESYLPDEQALQALVNRQNIETSPGVKQAIGEIIEGEEFCAS